MINYLSGVSSEFVSLHYRLQISYLFIWKYQLKLWNKICMYLSLFCVTCFLVFLRLELGFIFVFPQFCMKLESLLFFNIFSFLSHRWSNLVSHSWYFVLSQWKPPWYCIRTGANSYCNSRYPISLLFNVVRQIMLYIAFPFPVPLLAPRLVCLWMCVRENVCLVSIGCLCVCVVFFSLFLSNMESHVLNEEINPTSFSPSKPPYFDPLIVKWRHIRTISNRRFLLLCLTLCHKLSFSHRKLMIYYF